MIWLYKSVKGHVSAKDHLHTSLGSHGDEQRSLQISLRCDCLLVHAAAQSLDVITDVSDHAVPLVSL